MPREHRRIDQARTNDAHAALAAVGGLTLRWTPLPRDPSL